MDRLRHYRKFILYFLGIVVLLMSLQKEKEIGVNPYAGAKQPLGIQFTSNKAVPETGIPGEIVTLRVKGLMPYADEVELFLNETKVEVVSLTESTVDIRIPEEGSSGNISLIVQEQIFYGPRVGIEGKVSIDTDYKGIAGFNGLVAQILPLSGNFLVSGSFTDFNKEATKEKTINSIHLLSNGGNSVSGMKFGTGASGGINILTPLANGKIMAGGTLNAYNKRSVSGITRLNANGSLDTTVVTVINPNSELHPLDGLDTVPAFNGFLEGGTVVNVYEGDNNSVIAIGNFRTHYKIDYSYSSRTNKRLVYSKVNQVAKLKADGSLDSTFNMNNSGFNGLIKNSVRLKDGRIVIVGSFTSYNGTAVKNIVCIKANGDIDNSFLMGGTDKEILAITYNAITDKIAIAGGFKQVAGQTSTGVAVLNSDGTIDQSFSFGTINQGAPSYAYVLNNGRVLVQGSFLMYNGIHRGGLLILEANGEALQTNNVLGEFTGQINTLVETTSSLGNPALLLGGSISSVGGKKVQNIVKIELKN